MGRLDLLPENDFITQFKQLQADLEQIKTAQRSGRDIWKPKIVECLDGGGNPTAYDLVANEPDGFGGYLLRNFRASMVADTQEDVWATPIFKMFYGNPSTPSTSGQAAGFCYLDFPTTTTKEIGYKGYFGDNVYPFDHLVYIKVYFYATDTGILTVQGNP